MKTRLHFIDTKYTSNNIEEAMAQHLCCSNHLSATWTVKY